MARDVLIVDDDRVSAAVMAQALETLDVDVRVVADGMEAVARIRERVPDLVITDLEMPRMDGHKLVQWIRSNPDVDSLVIVVTAHSTPQDELEALEGGADEFVAKPLREPILRARVRSLLRLKHEMNELARSNERAKAALETLVEQRRRLDEQQRKLEQITITDELTGIFNRRFLNRRSEEEFAEAIRYGKPLSCLLADLDQFKSINDRLGHAAGDAVLAQFAKLVQGRLRQSDVFGRWGGEEFMILLPHTGAEEARAVAETLRTRTEAEAFRSGGETIPVTVSIGGASLPCEAATSVDTYIILADKALYRAKNEGRNRVRWAD